MTVIGFDVETSEVMILMTDEENYPSYKVDKIKLADAFEVEENDVEKILSLKIPFQCKLMKNEECDAVFTDCVILKRCQLRVLLECSCLQRFGGLMSFFFLGGGGREWEFWIRKKKI